VTASLLSPSPRVKMYAVGWIASEVAKRCRSGMTFLHSTIRFFCCYFLLPSFSRSVRSFVGSYFLMFPDATWRVLRAPIPSHLFMTLLCLTSDADDGVRVALATLLQKLAVLRCYDEEQVGHCNQFVFFVFFLVFFCSFCFRRWCPCLAHILDHVNCRCCVAASR
jgi:hypothetical protein